MIFVLFHANCIDGFMAAAICFKRFGDGATYIPCQYGSVLARVCEQWNITDQDEIFMVDFSYPRNELIACKCKMTILDHHKTAQENLIDLPPNIVAKFDMTKSGAVLTWEYFFDLLPPQAVYFVQDRDLWEWKMTYSKEFSAGLQLWSKIPSTINFEVWVTNLLDGSSENVTAVIKVGIVILEYQKQLIEKAVKESRFTSLPNGTIIMAVNAPNLQSEICDELLSKYLDLHFVGCFFYDMKTAEYIWSVRSRKGAVTTARSVATIFGGGGHDQAAGFKTKTPPIALEAK